MTARRLGRFAVLAGVLAREHSERTATETLRQQDRAANLATLALIWTDVTRMLAARQDERTIRSLLELADWQQYEQDAERNTLTRLLRAADFAGYNVDDLLHRAIVGTAEPRESTSYADRTPAIADPVDDGFACDLAAAMDQRALFLRKLGRSRPRRMRAHISRERYPRTRSTAPGGSCEPSRWLPTARKSERSRDRTHLPSTCTHLAQVASQLARRLRRAQANYDAAAANDGELWALRAVSATSSAHLSR